VVQSTETGTAYLVKTTVSVSNLASITGAADSQWNSVAISSASTDTNLTSTGLVDGTYKVYAVDAAGNLSSSSTNSVTLDTTAPTAPSVSGTTPTIDTTPTWSWSTGGGGNGTYRYKLNSSDLTSGATQTTSTSYTPGSGISEGSYTLFVQERDAAGNWSSSGSRAIIIDTTAPTAPSVSVTTPTNDTTPTWSWNAGGGGNGTYRYKLNSSDLTSGATQTTSTSYTPGSGISEGSYTLFVQERDAAGNWSSSGSSTIVIDTTAPTAPTLLLSSETTTKIEGTTTSTVGSVSVNGLETNATWQFSGTSGNTWTGNITGSLYALDTGTYSQVKSGGGRAKQTDQAGNTSAVSTGTSTLSAINCSGISVTLAKIDDNSEVYVNGTVRASKGFSGTSQETAITSHLVTGENKIIFKLTNGSSGYAYTYKVKNDSTYLFDETCGVWNQSGCNSDSYTSGLVVEIETTIQCE
jgi:hypothetical protein